MQPSAVGCGKGNLDATKFDAVFVDSLVHLNTNISKLRDQLEPQVIAATTDAEPDAIVW